MTKRKRALQHAMQLVALCFVMLGVFSNSALALDPVKVEIGTTALDITGNVDLYLDVGEALQVATAPDAEGTVRRIEVRSNQDEGEASPSGNWAVFALANDSTEQIDRLIVSPHFRLVNSGLDRPDLGSARINSITPSEGFSLERQENNESDIFLITLNPGSVITFVAELSSRELPQLYLWEPDAYKDTQNSFTLYRGIVLGIAGLLAVFLTILFVVKGSAMFPATAALAWAVLAYVCIDFGFLDKVIELTPGNSGNWRASTEVVLAGSLIIFLFAYLNLNRWHVGYSRIAILWLLGLGALLWVSVFDPPMAAGIARYSFAATAALGLLLILFLSFRGYDRAIMLIPTWMLILLWIFGAWLTVTGELSNDIIQPALGGGLVLIVMLIGFTVMQHAFAGGGLAQGNMSDMERQALALTGSGHTVWDWDVSRDRIFTSDAVAKTLGIPSKTLNSHARDWLEILHPDDVERFKTTLDVIVEHKRGRINQDFRLRSHDDHYYWFALRARPVLGSDGEVLRCVGTLSDITKERNSRERLLHDAVHDNLTGLPNRELFLDRLDAVIRFSKANQALTATVLMIDIDRFKQVNDSLGMSVGDNILLALARRLGRVLRPQDTLARISGDKFAVMLVSESETDNIGMFADALRTNVREPITFSGQEVFLTASIGLATLTPEQENAADLIKDAEIAMYQAKRFGGDRIEPFRPAFRTMQMDSIHIESDLRRALERGEIGMVYQPIINLSNNTISGYEALMRWEHPKRGLISPAEFIPIAEKSGLIIQLGLFALNQAASDLNDWQDALGEVPIFVSVNISSRQLLRHDLINDIKTVLTKTALMPGTLKLELTESLIMENPEQSTQVLQRVRNLGAGLALDDFGTGYSSLSYLMNYPFDVIKIDQSLVRATDKQERPVLLKSIVNMAHDLGMAVVAEGAETEADASDLRELGCEYAQGFLYGEPVRTDMVKRDLLAAYPIARRK